MTTNSGQSNARDQLASYHGSAISSGERVQSTAVRGANHAFTARGHDQDRKVLHSSVKGAQAAALSAGYATHQQSVPPPKSSSALAAALRSQSAGISQVQQLVKGFEQSSTSKKFEHPGPVPTGSERVQSRSPSQVAARVASGSSPSPLRTTLPVRSGGKDTLAVTHSDRPPSTIQIDTESHPEPTESVQSSSHEAIDKAPRPLEHAASAQILPATPVSEQSRSIEKLSAASDHQKRQSQRASSTIAARAAVRNTFRNDVCSVFEPSSSDHRKLSNSKGVHLEEFERGRKSATRRQTPGRAVSNASLYSVPDESPDLENSAGNLSSESSERATPNPTTQLGTLSVQSSHHLRPTSNAQYLDARTGLTEVSLADAIVASSLASSRAPSPAKKVPAPPRPRTSSRSRPRFLQRHSSDIDLPRHTIQHQGMRQTLRKNPSDDNEDEKSRRNHKHFMTHPNKHREGSRKRWKDTVTETERKRYEGVWAANKGIFLTNVPSLQHREIISDSSPSDLVLDLIVRDIWNRSRLPTESLAEIWDLVDRQGMGVLTRDEFVLGLWLIDQRLKGRKLPARVSPTLWASVRHARGLKIPRKI